MALCPRLVGLHRPRRRSPPAPSLVCHWHRLATSRRASRLQFTRAESAPKVDDRPISTARRRGRAVEGQPKTRGEERQDNNPAAHVRGRHGHPFSSPQWSCHTRSKRDCDGKIEQKRGQAAHPHECFVVINDKEFTVGRGYSVTICRGKLTAVEAPDVAKSRCPSATQRAWPACALTRTRSFLVWILPSHRLRPRHILSTRTQHTS